jgi:hypothetical protein
MLCLSFQSYGQSLIGLTENQEIKKAMLTDDSRKKSASAITSYELPFFDDFSIISIYPDNKKWSDYYAFINSSLPYLPPTIGVATLDAIDAHGNVYAIDNRPTPSDTLTSVPINLLPYKGSSRQVKLSFFYQAGGRGEIPDPADSLILEYYSVIDSQWVHIWKTTTDTSTPFIQVINIVPESFYEDGFRFRFRNYTSMSPDEVKGKSGALSNVDQWHIDYVKLDTENIITHEKIADIAFVEPLKGMLKQYVSVPWSHVNYAQSIMRQYTRYVIRNMEDSVRSIYRSYNVKDLNTNKKYYYNEYDEMILPNTMIIRNDPFDHGYTQTQAEYGRYEVTAFITTPPGQFRGNDTVKYYQEFRDYYAYDDGTPEFGFGISGESSYGALVAVRFPLYRQDTIRGIEIFFNKTRNNYTADIEFNLCVWNNLNGKPGDLIYLSEEAFTPDTTLGLLEFKRYMFPSDINIIVSDTVYVGLRQLSEDFLNIGYDNSCDTCTNILINISGPWFTFTEKNPLYNGTLMIRPVFSRNSSSGITEKYVTGENTLNIFPVPATDQLHIALSDNDQYPKGEVNVFDISGRLIMNCSLSETISVNQLEDGIYFIKIRLVTGKSYTSKFVIRR